MKVPFNWLKEYVPITITPKELADKLVSAGFEVEEIVDLSAGMGRVVTGKALNIAPHKNADKLRVCLMDTGGELLTVVTGAQNVAEGDTVPVALEGAVLPDGKEIKAAELRGVFSYGMLCSGRELCIDDACIKGASADGILILPPDTALGAPIAQVLKLDDSVLDISVTPNRPDCQSVLGIAREAAAVLGVKVKYPSTYYKCTENSADIKVTVREQALCPRYMAAEADSIKLGEAPDWMRERLYKCGVRSINNIVDITNYVLLETGQPMHAFDKAKLNGGELVIRRAAEGEALRALDGNDYKMKTDMLVIANAKCPIAIAGVMGGEDASVSGATATIVFESARFDRACVRNTSRVLGLRSDSSARFERGVDFFGPEFGLERALALVYKLKCGDIRDGIKDVSVSFKPRIIVADIGRINAVLGIEVTAKKAAEILNSLDIETAIDKNTLTCRVPLFREDLEDFSDLAEEIIRIYGYENIVGTSPKSAAEAGAKNALRKRMDKSVATLCGLGFSEIVTYSLINPASDDDILLASGDPRRRRITLLNPLSEEMSVLRTSLVHNLISVAELNQKRKNGPAAFFEIAKIFRPSEAADGLPDESYRLGLAAYGDCDFYDLKAAVCEAAADFGVTPVFKPGKEPYLHPGKSADIYIGGAKTGSVGEVHPETAERYRLTEPLYIAELDYDKLAAYAAKAVVYKPLYRYPKVERDLAFIVGSKVMAGEITAHILKLDPLIISAEVFDVYTGAQAGEGKKSVAVKMFFCAPDRTLKDSESAELFDRVINSVKKAFDASLRMS
ncbi:MAG: phenylalanine--tRNA ligase subunit beta [Firmicutes bacterium]|nr:phenylalanine--tRNA ligase subunit beta [Bacillota bacterium]